MESANLAQGLDLPKRAIALVLAGGRGSRLMNLTDRRAKPAVYFGGKFRIVDFALSNCLNSGVRRIGVITQYKSHSLLRHLQRGWVDALKRASARRITAVIPYFGYARQDRRPRSTRVPISAKVVANLLETVGVERLLTMDLHADQIQGFFDIPVDNIYASPVLLSDVKSKAYPNLVVISPDVGDRKSVV